MIVLGVFIDMGAQEQDEPLSLEEFTDELGAAIDTDPEELARRSEEFTDELGPPEEAALVDK